MNIELKVIGKLAILHLNEQKIDEAFGDEIKSKVLELVSKGHKQFLLNLSKVDSIDSSGLGALINIGQKLQLTTDSYFAFCNTSKKILNVFDVTRLSQFFSYYVDETTAVQAILSKELRQKKFAYIGENLSVIQMLQKLASQQGTFEQFNKFEQFDQLTNSKEYEGLLIEEKFLPAHFQSLLEKNSSLKNKPIVLIADACKITHLKELKEKSGIHHIIELPFDFDDARVLVAELMDYLSVRSNQEQSKMTEQLFQQYANSLFDKLGDMEELVEKVQANCSKDTIAALRESVHKISGSAGTYGYIKAGEICRLLELLLTSALRKEDYNSVLSMEIKEFFEKIKFYFNATFYKDLSKKNISVRPVTKMSAFIISSDSTVCDIFLKLAIELKLKMGIEIDPDRVIKRLNELDFKPELILIESKFPDSSQTGLDIIKAIKNSVLTTGIKFGLLVEEENLEASVLASKEGVQFIIKKPLSSKDVDTLFNRFEGKKISQPYKILVIDDDVDICNFIKTTLEAPNIIVRTITDETKTLDNLYEFRPHLLLLDIHLKNYDGWALLKTLRTDLRYRDLKIIIVSSSTRIEGLKQKHGYDDIWTKPLDKIQLQDNIHDLAEAYFALNTSQQRISTFLPKRDFKTLLQTFLKAAGATSDPFYLVVIGSAEYSAFMEAGLSEEEEYLISSENLLNQFISENTLRGYLDEGRFAFLFSQIEAKDLEAMLARLLIAFDYKIMISVKSEEIFATFSACATSFLPSQVQVEDLLSYAISAFDKSISQGSRQATVSYDSKLTPQER